MATRVVAQLAPVVDGARVALHVLAATVRVGGQVTLAGLVPSARQLGQDAPRLTARAVSRLNWSAYAVLLTTGIWNVAVDRADQRPAWQVVLGVKIAVVLLAGLSAWRHGRAQNRAVLAAWGAFASSSSLAAVGSRRLLRRLRKPTNSRPAGYSIGVVEFRA